MTANLKVIHNVKLIRCVRLQGEGNLNSYSLVMLALLRQALLGSSLASIRNAGKVIEGLAFRCHQAKFFG